MSFPGRLKRFRSLPVSRAAPFLLLAATVVTAEPRSYRIEPQPDSRFALEVYKTGLMSGRKHVLVFERYGGLLEYDAENPRQSRVELTIESASLVVTDDWVNEKDRRKIADEALNNKLEVDKYPEMRFRSGSVAAKVADGDLAKGTGGASAQATDVYDVSGELTIRDLARPVNVHVTVRQGDDGVLLFDGEAVVRMKDYGMGPPSAALGLIGTRNEMQVRFRLRAEPVTR